MTERERLARIIEGAFFHATMNGRTGEERCLAAAAAILSAGYGPVGEYREALRFYADRAAWEAFEADSVAAGFDRNHGSELGDDMGDRARALLGEDG